MISVRSLQYAFSRDAYQRMLRVNGGAVNTDVISLMWRDIMFRTDTTPLSGKYRVTPYETIDLAALNAELSLIQIDTDTITAFIETYLLYLSDLEYVADVWKEYATRTIDTTIADLRSFYGNRFIDGITTIISPRKKLDDVKSTATVNADDSLSVSPIIATMPAVSVHANDISITPVGNNSTATLTGDAIDMFNPAKPAFIMTLNGRTTGLFGFDITIKTDFPLVNCIRLDFGTSQSGLKVIIAVTSGSMVTTVFDAVVNAQFVTASVPVTFSSVTISVRRDEPTSHTLTGTVYEFIMKHIAFLQAQIVTDATFYSKRIDLDPTIKSAYLVTKETVSGHGNASFYVATTEENGQPASYRPITQNQLDSTIVFGQETHAHTCRLAAGMTSWPTCADSFLGIRGMAISKYLATDLVSKIIAVDHISGAISSQNEEYEILYDLIELHRGYRDYTFTYSPDTNRIDATKLTYRVYANADTNWVEPLPLQYIDSIPVTSDMIIAVATNATTVRIPYVIENAETLELKLATGTMTKPRILSVLNATEYCDITMGLVLDLRKPYTINIAVSFSAYLTRKRMRCELTTADVVITTEQLTLIPYTDFVLREDTLEIELLKHGQYGQRMSTGTVTGSIPAVTISYAFVSTSNAMRKVYETQVYVEKPTPITVLPFSATDVAAGNFHKCNGELISYASSYMLNRGWNRIQTTQPYPNSKSMKEVNQCTGIFSNAAIIFPSDIAIYRAYQNPMRRVPLFMLNTIPRDDINKCFAVHEKKVIIAFQPDYCDTTILGASKGTIPDGRIFTCRRPVVNTKFANTGYVSAPEQFHLIVPVKKANVDNFIYLKVVLSQPDTASAVRVDTIGINTFKE